VDALAWVIEVYVLSSHFSFDPGLLYRWCFFIFVFLGALYSLCSGRPEFQNTMFNNIYAKTSTTDDMLSSGKTYSKTTRMPSLLCMLAIAWNML